MRQYWHNLQERDRWALIIGGGLAALYLGYLLFFAPLLHAVANNRLELQDKQETWQWLQKVSTQNLGKKNRQVVSSSNQLLTLLTRDLKSNQTLAFPYQLQQTGGGDIQLSFAEVPFNAVITWLNELEGHYQITLKQFNAERLPKAGIVKLQLVLAK